MHEDASICFNLQDTRHWIQGCWYLLVRSRHCVDWLDSDACEDGQVCSTSQSVVAGRDISRVQRYLYRVSSHPLFNEHVSWVYHQWEQDRCSLSMNISRISLCLWSLLGRVYGFCCGRYHWPADVAILCTIIGQPTTTMVCITSIFRSHLRLKMRWESIRGLIPEVINVHVAGLNNDRLFRCCKALPSILLPVQDWFWLKRTTCSVLEKFSVVLFCHHRWWSRWWSV